MILLYKEYNQGLAIWQQPVAKLGISNLILSYTQQQEKKETARKMKQKGIPVETIAEVTELSLTGLPLTHTVTHDTKCHFQRPPDVRTANVGNTYSLRWTTVQRTPDG